MTAMVDSQFAFFWSNSLALEQDIEMKNIVIKDLERELAALLNKKIEPVRPKFQYYVPVKGDQIDEKLAEYINNYPERSKLKIMFMRESEGVY